MDDAQKKPDRKLYSKPCIIMETTLEIVAGTPVTRPGSDGLLDPNQTFFP